VGFIEVVGGGRALAPSIEGVTILAEMI